MKRKFKVGDKVRCIDTNWQGWPVQVYPVYQGIYTISEYIFNKGRNSVILKEIPKEQTYNGKEWIIPFLEFHFEKATETGAELIIVAKEKLKVQQYQLS